MKLEERKRVQHPGGGEIITKQAPSNEMDINRIMSKYIKGSALPEPGKEPRYGDFSNAGDFHTALEKVNRANADFMELPAMVRRHVNHDLGAFLEMVHDPERVKELEELGLVPERNPAVELPPPPVVEGSSEESETPAE